MQWVCKYIGVVLIGLMWTLTAYCQEISGDRNLYGNLMDRYETACGKCLEMKHLVKSGSKVSRQEARDRLDDFISLNKQIKAVQTLLPGNLNSRFMRINQWFASGIRPAALDDRLDTPQIDNPLTDLATTVRPPAPVPGLQCSIRHGNDTREVARKPSKTHVFILASVSAPVSYGLRAGFLSGRWGGYLSARSNFSKFSHSYSCTSDSTTENGLVFWGTGRARRNNLSAQAGLVFNAVRWLDIYAGAGYGFRNMYFEDIEQKWAMVSDLSHKGLAAETGVVVSWKKLAFSLGISTIKFRTMSADFGIGIRF